MLLIGTQDAGKKLSQRGNTKSVNNVVFVFENATGCVFVYLCICVFVYLCICVFENADLASGICCVKGDLKNTLLAPSRSSKGWGH